MVICVDVGNTTVAVAAFKENKILVRNFFDYETSFSKEEFLTYLKSLKDMPCEHVRSVIYSSVVPPIDNDLISSLEEFYKAKVYRIDKTNKKLLSLVDVENPQEVGEDLLADVVGGIKKYGYPLLIVDIGTASKVLYIDERSKFVSANILPGLGLCVRSLFKDTNLLPKIELKIPETVIAKETYSAMNTGLVYGHVDMLEGIIKRYEKELNKKIKVVVTGGYINILQPLFNKDYIFDLTLTMYGLNELLKLNERR